jgi:plasmid stabilization system protein ParE
MFTFLCQTDRGQNHPPFRADRRPPLLRPHSIAEYDAEDIREIIEKPYRIIYRIKPTRIDVLAVIHGAQPLPDKI